MSDPRRNAEHYMDMTAYMAIRNAERELGMLPKNGEVWKVDYNGVERTVVVVAAHEGYCTVLLLNDERKSDSDLMCVVGANMYYYTDPGKLAYRYNNIFTEREAALTDSTFRALLCGVADALCIKADEQTDEVEEYKRQLAFYKVECAELGRDNAKMKAELERCQQPMLVNGDAEMAALRAERDVYKTLYTETLAKLMERR